MVIMEKVRDQVLPQLPKKLLSHYVGYLAHRPLPRMFRQQLLNTFAKFYKLNVAELEKPLAEYESIGELFSRRLHSTARPLQGPVIHPCDGRVVQSGIIHDSTLIQAKGKTFKLADFVPFNPWPEKFEEGLFTTYYLAPHNYHRVHMPMTGKIRWVSVNPGELWPVNAWSVRNIANLYAINERVAIGFETEQGMVILVMVGATNVGSIDVNFDQEIKTNRRSQRDAIHRTYPQPLVLEVGDELGKFNLGSTVVVLFDKSFNLKPMPKRNVQMGQASIGTAIT